MRLCRNPLAQLDPDVPRGPVPEGNIEISRRLGAKVGFRIARKTRLHKISLLHLAPGRPLGPVPEGNIENSRRLGAKLGVEENEKGA